MSKITQNYIEARRDGIKWLNSQKRDYSTGVNILTRSGYKGFVAARLARQGEKPHTREKLEYEIRQMIKVWYHPDDPRFEDVDLADDAMPGNDGRSETVPEETAAIVAVAERELAREADEQPAYPPVMAKIIYDFRECYNERSLQHRMLAGLGETNTQAVCTQRKDIVARIAFLSNRMTLLAAIKRQFEQDRELPTEEQLDELYKKTDTPEENPEKEEDETDISSLSVEELKKAKSNAKSKITKARNMLLYSSESKPKDGKENPLPDCPKRVKYEKKVAVQEALVERIEYRLAELQ